MKRTANLFKGLNTDLSYDSLQSGFYIDAINMRVTTTRGESNASITNFKGTQSFVTIPQDNVDPADGTKEIIGVTYIRNKIVLLCTDDSNVKGWIYTLEYDEVTGALGSITEKYYATDLYFSKSWPIEAIGRFESDCIQRIYWVDYNNYFRSVNLEDSNLASTPVGLIDVFPNISYVFPKLTNVFGGGALSCGAWTYSYKLITFDGKETLISPPGNLIHVTADFETTPTPRYMGRAEGTGSTKAHEITVDTSNYGDFEKIELIAAFYSDFTASPTVYIVESKVIGSSTEVVFTHTGDEENTEEIDYTEFASKQYPFKTFKTLAAKDNSLIPANIKGSNFDLSQLLEAGESFDARTGRYNSALKKPHPETGTAEEIEDDKNLNAFNATVDSTHLGIDPVALYGISVNDFNSTGFNHDEHWETGWHDNKQFKFQSDGARLGGEGPNISYTFHLEDFWVDGNNTLAGNVNLPAAAGFTSINLNDGNGNYPNTAYDDMASPFRSGLLRGYKRGETYRFGIVFYNIKGEASFVQHIGDIKFPDLSDEDSVTTATLNGNSVTYFPISAKDTSASPHIRGFSLGIAFELDFSTCTSLIDESKISGFQIVRLKREPGDSRRLCTGVMRNMMKFNIDRDPDPRNDADDMENFDLAAPGADRENIVHLYPFTMYYTSAGNNGGAAGTIKMGGANSNFHTLNDEFNDSSSYNDFPIYGTALTFYSPELSYNFPYIRSSAVSSGQNMLLITGRFKDYLSNATGAPSAGAYALGNAYTGHVNPDDEYYDFYTQYDSTDYGDVGPYIQDFRRSLKTTGQVDKSTTVKAIEYVKQWKSSQIVDFTFGSDYNNSAALAFGVSPYLGYTEDGTTEATHYIRNFYGYLDLNTIGLNDCNPDNSTSPPGNAYPPDDGSESPYGTEQYMKGLSKGATGLTGTIGNPTQNPYTGNAVAAYASGLNYFASYDSNNWRYVDVKYFGGDLANVNEGTLPQARLNSTPILDLLVPRSEIYGGANIDALEANIFIPASPVLDISLIDGTTYATVNPIVVYGGDIFITPFVWQDMATWIHQDYYQRAYQSGNATTRADQPFAYNFSSTTTMIIESRINCELAYGCTLNRGVRYDAPGGPTGNPLEIYRQEAGNYDSNYAKVLTMYSNAYNEAYSRDQDSIPFTIKPAAFDLDCSKNDIRAFISNVKTNEEEIDSWTKFGANNAYDVDDYGSINKVINHKDEIYFVQNKAVGKYSINPRAITSTEDGIPTELGSAKGFQDHTYLTTEHGSIHQWGIKQTDLGVYFFDAIHRKIFQIGTDSTSPLSEIKGIHGLLASLKGEVLAQKFESDGSTPRGDNPILGKGVHIAKDLINNELHITFRGVENNEGKNSDFTIVYDEIAQQFVSFYSTKPGIYVENGDILISPDPDNPEQLYKHNTGAYGDTYGTIVESSVSVVINEMPDMNKILRFVEFNSIVRDDNKLIDRTKTITAFKVETEYQTTGKIDVSSGRIKRRFDKWRLKLPRNQNGTKNDRLRSTYFILTLYFDNSENKELILNRVHSYFDIQVF